MSELLGFQIRNLPPWRQRLIHFTNHWTFRGTVYLAITYAAGQLAWPYVNWPDWNSNAPVNPADPTISINAASDVVELVIFIAEAVVKILAFGGGLDFLWRKKGIQEDSESVTAENQLKPEEESKISEIFKLFDVDRSGSMSELELRLALRGLGFDESPANIRRLFREMDSDQNNEIDYQEFKEVMTSKIVTQPQPPGYFQSHWNQFDFFILFVSCIVLPIQFFEQNAKKVGDIARLLRLARMWGLFDTPRLIVMRDLLRVLTLSIWRSGYICFLISSVLLVFATIGVDLFSDGQLHARCAVAPDNVFAARWDTEKFGRGSTVGLLEQPERHCGHVPCGEGFTCACNPDNRESSAEWSPLNRGCGMIPVGQLGEKSGKRPVTLDYGFLGFDNTLQGFLTTFISISRSRWTRSLEAIQYAYYPATAFCFFVCLFTFGRLWIANLFGACVYSAYCDVFRERRSAERARAGALAEARVVQRLKRRAEAETSGKGGLPTLAGMSSSMPLHGAARQFAANRSNASGQSGADMGFKRMFKSATGLRASRKRERTPSVVMSIGTAASQVMLERLGDLKDANPRDLSAKIQAAFTRYDTGHTGFVPLQDMRNLLAAVGIDLIPEEAKPGPNKTASRAYETNGPQEETLWNQARKNDDGCIDEDEFEELVKAVIAKVRREAREAEQAAWEMDEDSRQVRCCGLFWISRAYMEPNTAPLSRVALLSAKIVAYPHQLDECGERVPDNIMHKARLRNLQVVFGPNLGDWQVRALKGGASKGVNRRSDQKQRFIPGVMMKELFPSDQNIPGGHGVSVDGERKDLEGYINGFDLHSTVLDENGKVLPSFSNSSHDAAMPYFEVVALSCITFSSVLMCCVHYDNVVDVDCQDMSRCPQGLRIMSETWDTCFAGFEYAFNGIFTLEALLKISGGGFLRYIVVGKNRFDFIVVVICDIGLIMWSVGSSRSQVSFIRLIRMVRMMQLFRMVNGFLHFERLYQKFLAGIRSQIPILFTLIFTISTAAIIGMRMFPCIPPPDPDACEPRDACKPLPNINFSESESSCLRSSLCPVYLACPFDPVYNFDSFSDAFRVIFIVTMTQGWEDVMIAGMRMYKTPAYSLFFFIPTFVFFNYFVSSVFLAAVIDSFRTSDEEKERHQLEEFRRATARLLENDSQNIDEPDKNDKMPVASFMMNSNQEEKEGSGSVLWFAERKARQRQEAIARSRQGGGLVFGCLSPPAPENMPSDSRNVRGIARDLLRSVWWENCVFAAIVLSSVQLSLQSPIDEFSTAVFLNRQIGNSLSYTVTLFCFSVFLLEMILKMVENGLFWESEKAYFRQMWNWVDFTIIVAFSLELGGLSYVTVIRILRSLRITRLIRFGPVVLLQQVLTSAMWDLRLVFIMSAFVFCVMAIMAQSFFFGALNYCTDSDQGLRVTHLSIHCDGGNPNCDNVFGRLRAADVRTRVECVGIYFHFRNSLEEHFVYQGDYTEIMRPRVWSAPTFSFDNFGTSLQTLIEVFSLDEWVMIAASAEGFKGIGINPIPKEEASVWLYFIFFVMFTRLFILPVFLGVLMDHLGKIQGTAMSTSLQENWRRFSAKLDLVEPIHPPRPPTLPLRRRAFFVVQSIRFLQVCDVVLLLNAVVLAANYYNVDPTWAAASYWSNFAFVAFYAGELTLKLLAYGLPFFEEPWNMFDFTVVGVGILEVCSFPGLGFRAVLLFRVIRTFRIVRILRRLTRLQLLLSIITNSSRLILGCFLLLAVFVFFFAVIGCQFLAGVRYGRRINKSFNFDTTLNSFSVLFVIATGDGFSAVIREAGVAEPACTRCYACKSDLDGTHLVDFSDCGIPGAMVFLDVYLLVSTLIFLQLLVAIVLDMYYTSLADTRFVLQGSHVESFCQRWNELDPAGTGRISVWCFRTLLERLHLDNNPLGSCGLTDEFSHRSLRFEIMEDKEDAKYFEFRHTLRTLSLRVAGDRALSHVGMMRRRERLAFYAQAAVLGKAALLFTQQKHVHDVQVDAINTRHRKQEEECGVELNLNRLESNPEIKPKEKFGKLETSAKRAVFCFALAGGDRLLVVDANTGTCFVRAAPGSTLPLVPVWENSSPWSNSVLPIQSICVPNSTKSQQTRPISLQSNNQILGAGSIVSDNVMKDDAFSGPQLVNEDEEVEPLESWKLDDVVLEHDRSTSHQSDVEAVGQDNSIPASRIRVFFRGADGQRSDIEFLDEAQVCRFMVLVQEIRHLTASRSNRHLAKIYQDQIEKGVSSERDPLEFLEMRFILGTAATTLEREISKVAVRNKKLD